MVGLFTRFMRQMLYSVGLYYHVSLYSLQFLVKKEGFGGGGSRMLQFHQGQGDHALLKASGRTLNITIGPGLPSSTSKCSSVYASP